MLQWRRDIAAKRLVLPRGVLDVQATLADGSIFGQTGKLNFVDVALQPTTGALQLRAEFPNPQHTLLPGQFVRVRLLGLKRNDAILVPQRAVQQGLSGPFVYVLADSNKVSVAYGIGYRLARNPVDHRERPSPGRQGDRGWSPEGHARGAGPAGGVSA